MKRIILVLSLTLSFIYGDDPCIGEGATKEIFTKNYPYNIVIKKYYYEDDCGYKKYTIDIFQNNKKVDTLSEYYGVDLISDKDINNDGKLELVISGYSGGYGTDKHRIGVIEPNMKKLFSFDGFKINLQDIDKDNNFEFIQSSSIFFCISNEFCSNVTSLPMKLSLEFKDYNLSINQKAMSSLKKGLAEKCHANVKIMNKTLYFSDNYCAKNNLLAIAYDIYIGDTKSLKSDFTFFSFSTPQAKEKFKKHILKENFDYIDKKTFSEASKEISKY